MELWAGLVYLVAGIAVGLVFCAIQQLNAFLMLILRVLHERGILDIPGVIRAMREKEMYPFYATRFLVGKVCEQGIRKGLIVRRGLAVIPRYSISEKGRMALDEHDWRKGNKKISL